MKESEDDYGRGHAEGWNACLRHIHEKFKKLIDKNIKIVLGGKVISMRYSDWRDFEKKIFEVKK